MKLYSLIHATVSVGVQQVPNWVSQNKDEAYSS